MYVETASLNSDSLLGSSMSSMKCIITKDFQIENMYATCVSLLTQEMIGKRIRLP